MLWKIRPLMNEEERKRLQVSLTPLMQRLLPQNRYAALLLCLDAWSDKPALTPEQWLAIAWHVRSGWRIVPANEPLPEFDLFANEPLPIPPVAAQAIESLARILDYAWTDGTKAFDERYFQGLNGMNTTAPIPRRYGFMALSRVIEWKRSGLINTHSMADLLKMDLHLLGLHVLDEKGIGTLRELARNHTDPFFRYGLLLYRTENPANPWTRALQDPQTAAQEVDHWIGHARQSWALNDLVFWMEKSPPEADVVHAIWDALRRKSHQGGFDDRPLVFGTLFRMCHLVSREERLAMRRDYLIATRAVGFAWNDFNDLDAWSAPWDPLQYPGGGIGIPWEEDELSAARSWTTHFGRLTHFTPDEGKKTHANSAYRYLALGVFPMYEIDLRKPTYDRVKLSPLSAPFEASPWQKAREPHLRRPDLGIR